VEYLHDITAPSFGVSSTELVCRGRNLFQGFLGMLNPAVFREIAMKFKKFVEEHRTLQRSSACRHLQANLVHKVDRHNPEITGNDNTLAVPDRISVDSRTQAKSEIKYHFDVSKHF